MSRPRGRGATSRDLLAAELRRRILDLTLEPGSLIAENELAAEMSVSRTPVREALILLARERLVEIYPQVGTFVAPINQTAVADAQFVREALETASLRDLAPVVGEDHITALREILARQQVAVEASDVDGFFELDEELHRAMMTLAGHGSAWDVVSHAKAHLDRARRACLPVADTLGRMLEQHTGIVDRLAARAVGDAERALRAHLREVFRDLEVVRTSSPGYFTDRASRPTRRARLT